MGIKCAETIVDEDSTGMRVDRPSERNTCLLTTGEIDTAFADFGSIAVFEDLEIGFETACEKDGAVAGRVVG